MKKWFLMPVLVLLLAMLIPSALAVEEQSEIAQRTSFGMRVNVDGTVSLDGKLICAVYDENGRMIGVELVSDPADILVYCDVNEARRVSVFAVDEETMAPVDEPVETQLAATETPIHVHTWDSGKVTQATCTQDGQTLYTCTSCDDADAVWTESIPATGHSWDEGTVTVEPTAHTDGKKVYTCVSCGKTKTQTLPMLDPKDVMVVCTGTSMKVEFLCEDPALLPADGVWNLSAAVASASLSWGGTQVYSQKGQYIYYSSVSGRYYFSISPNYQNLDTRLEGMTLTLTPVEGSAITEEIVLTNEEFVYEYTVGEQPVPQNFDTVYTETVSGTSTMKRINVTGLDPQVFRYYMQYALKPYGNISQFQLMYYPDYGGHYYGGYYLDYAMFEGCPVSVYSLSAETTAIRLSLTQSQTVWPRRTGKYIGGTAVNLPGTTTVSFAPTEDGKLHSGMFTWATTSEGTYTNGCFQIGSDSELTGNSYSSYGLLEDGKTQQQQTFHILPRLLEGFQKTTDFLDMYFYFIDADGNMSALSPVVKVTAVEGEAVTDVEGTGAYALVSLTSANDIAYITSAPGSRSSVSSTSYTGGGTFHVLVSDLNRYVSPVLWTWDGVLTNNADGSYAMNLVYHPIVVD